MKTFSQDMNVVPSLEDEKLTDRLNSVLETYEKFYHKDAKQLKKAIPSTEVWRYFIDGNRQDEGWIGFEKTEPGYLHAMLLAFQTIFEPYSDLNEFILKTHLIATNNVKNVGDIDSKSSGCYRDIDTFAPLPQSSSTAGIKELLNYLYNYPSGIEAPTIHYCNGKPGIIKSTFVLARPVILSEEQKTLVPRIINSNIFKYNIPVIVSTQIDRKILMVNSDQQLIQILKSPQTYSVFRFIFNGCIKSTINIKMIEACKQYETNIRLAKLPLLKLKVIFEFVQYCERLHPFVDGNTRTFSMLIMNALLIQNQMPIIMHENPNMIYTLTFEEFAKKAIYNMKITLNLAQDHSLYLNRTTKIISNLSMEEKTHFTELLPLVESENTVFSLIKLSTPYQQNKQTLEEEKKPQSSSEFEAAIFKQIKNEGKKIIGLLDDETAFMIFNRMHKSKLRWLLKLKKLGYFKDVNDLSIDKITEELGNAERFLFLKTYSNDCLFLSSEQFNKLEQLISPFEFAKLKKIIKEDAPIMLVKLYNIYCDIPNFTLTWLHGYLSANTMMNSYSLKDLTTLLLANDQISEIQKVKIKNEMSLTNSPYLKFFKPACVVMTIAALSALTYRYV